MSSLQVVLLGAALLGQIFDTGEFPPEPGLTPIHSAEFEEAGTTYVLSSKKEPVVAFHESVAREVVRYCARMLVIQIMPQGTPRETSEALMLEVRAACEQDALQQVKEEGYLPPDTILTRK
ncbi:MAG TPA: hypothetical protein VGB97_03725 [Candidatus Paceibacterota bacterium]|jgi:hypothetical protein